MATGDWTDDDNGDGDDGVDDGDGDDGDDDGDELPTPPSFRKW